MELLRALAALAEPPSPALAPVADALDLGQLPAPEVHTDLFDLQLYPFASVYLGVDGMLGGEARDRIAGFWRAVGAEPPAEPDHVTALLGGLASLVETTSNRSSRGADPQAEHACRAFLNEHVLSWLPAWLASLERLCATDGKRGFYRRWGRLLEASLGGLHSDGTSPDTTPLHFRDVPGLVDPRQAGAESLLSGLVAPAVSGVILVRDDLARCARDLGLGLRRGERRFVLRALLGQDAPATLGWLADEAARQASALADSRFPIAHWRERAEGSAKSLRALARTLPAS